MLILEPNNKNEDIKYYVNTNKTILYIHNKATNKLIRKFSDQWSAMTIECKTVDDDGNEGISLFDFKTLISKDAPFITKVNCIASTIKKAGFFKDFDDDTGISTNYLNEFLGSEYFIDAILHNKYSKKSKILTLISKETPVFNDLLKNLFFNESDEVILNFLRWLKICCFSDKRQDIIYLFCGTNEINQGQGAGKGVLIEFLNKMLFGLTVSVDNKTYETNFNSNLLNKKVVVFDEVNFKSLKYEAVKNITGSSLLRVEFKGKEPINAENIGSWLMFSNEHDLCDKITYDDRRTFIIRPNPKNGSLTRLIKSKYSDYDNFKNKLHNEIENLIHILALNDNHVLNPIELKTNAKNEYFKDKTEIEVIDLKDFYQFIVNKKMTQKLIRILESNNLFDDKIKLKLIKKSILNYKLFFEIFQVLQRNGFFQKKESPLFAWERLKEFSLKNGFEIIHIDQRETKQFQRYKDKTLLLKAGINSKELREIKQQLRMFYGVEKQIKPLKK